MGAAVGVAFGSPPAAVRAELNVVFRNGTCGAGWRLIFDLNVEIARRCAAQGVKLFRHAAHGAGEARDRAVRGFEGNVG